jgi:ATP-dependent DNA helicase
MSLTATSSTTPGKFGKIVNEAGEVLLDKKASRAESMAQMAKSMLELDGNAIRIVNKDDSIIG